MKFRLFTFLMLLISAHLQAQSNESILKKANEYFDQALYKEAIPLYQAVWISEPKSAEINFKLGYAYLMGAEKAKALPHLQQAYNARPTIHQEILYYLGKAYQANHQFDEAKMHYTQYLEKVEKDDASSLKIVNRKISECETGAELIATPVKAKIENLGVVVNSRYAEYAPVISADESIMMFTSRREGSVGGKLAADNQFYEDIYIAYNNNGLWTDPINLGAPINTKTHDACVALAPDGKQLFMYNDKNGGDIFTSTQQVDRSWTKPISLGKHINTRYRESSISITKDGQIVYFSSDRPGGYGGMDIYMSKRQPTGQWGEAINLGPAVNTSFDEDAPFIHPDGKTLYFSSRGHKGMGGYDIFRTEQMDGKWTSPENIGYPINTTEDDIYFVLSADNKHGYYASERPGGRGEKDIYVISMPTSESIASNEAKTVKVAFKEMEATKPLSFSPAAFRKSTNPTTILRGQVLDALTNAPLSCLLLLIDNEKNEVVSEQVSDSLTGAFTMVIPSGKNYGLTIEKEGYLFHSENFDLPPSTEYQELNKDVKLKRLAIGSRVVLRNIFFETGKSTIKPESAYELEKLVRLLSETSNMKIEISGHTDNVGKPEFNKKLSKERANAVINYLVSRGISSDRLRSAGYGPTKPYTSNDSATGRQLNRRTEFEIIGN